MPGGLCFLYLLASSGIACQLPLHRAISISFAITSALFVTIQKKKGRGRGEKRLSPSVSFRKIYLYDFFFFFFLLLPQREEFLFDFIYLFFFMQCFFFEKKVDIYSDLQ